MKVLLLLAIVIVVLLAIVLGRGAAARPASRRQLEDARAEAQRWYERLGGQVMNLHGDDPAARQALADAGERYNAAGGQLQQAKYGPAVRAGPRVGAGGPGYVRAARIGDGHRPGSRSCRRWPPPGAPAS